MIYRFGEYELDTNSFALTGVDGSIAVEPQVFSLLQLLIENAERVVTKDEIIDAVWDSRAISDSALNSRINAARRALGDDGKTQAVIKTFPRRGFRFVAEVEGGGRTAALLPTTTDTSGKPSIAVLPFDNLTGDPDQVYFSDGISEDIITALSRVPVFIVIARNTMFTYKDTSLDVKSIAEELDVRYVLAGSVRKGGSRVRITAQLVEGETGNNIWTEHYDRELEDIFAVQDNITQTVVAALEPTMSKAERQRAITRKPENLDAWDHYHRGMNHLYDKGDMLAQPHDLERAKAYFSQCIESDPQFSRAYAGLAHCHQLSVITGATDDPAKSLDVAFEAVKNFIRLDERDAYAHAILANTYMLRRDPLAAIRECKIAIQLNPNTAQNHFFVGQAYICAGEATTGIDHLEMALRLGNRDPAIGPATGWMALALRRMGDRSVQQRLAAVLAADVAGYTRLMEQDSAGTVAAWQDAREDVIKPRVGEFSGNIVKLTGDGFLVEFPTVQNAVRCAIALQEELVSSPLNFRMGVNLGDIIDDGEDIHGEGVNIAARIEALADEGGINISGMVYESVRNRIDATYEDQGEHVVKNVSAPVRVYAIRLKDAVADYSSIEQAIADKPSIAVLPFDNLSGDPEQDFIGDGLTEDIIAGLSHIRSFFVIARSSTFQYKGTPPDIRHVAQELGVRYVLEGSVRRAADRIRVTAQLSNLIGKTIWPTHH